MTSQYVAIWLNNYAHRECIQPRCLIWITTRLCAMLASSLIDSVLIFAPYYFFAYFVEEDVKFVLHDTLLLPGPQDRNYMYTCANCACDGCPRLMHKIKNRYNNNTITYPY